MTYLWIILIWAASSVAAATCLHLTARLADDRRRRRDQWLQQLLNEAIADARREPPP